MTVPISIRLSVTEFNQLEAIAMRRGVTIRQLLQAHIRAGLSPERVVRPVRRGQLGQFSDQDIAQWVLWAESGVTNNEIALRSGVSKSLVSRYLIDRGVRRHERRNRRAVA